MRVRAGEVVMWEHFKRGWAMAKASSLILRRYPKLALLPSVSGLAIVLVAILPFIGSLMPQTGPLHTAMKAAWSLIGEPTATNPRLYAAGFAGLYVITVIAIFFNVALLFCALRCLEGETPTLRGGLKAALGRMPQILGWAAVSLTVGIVLSMVQDFLERYLSFLGTFIGGVLNIGWAALTYFVMPVLVVEKVGPITAVRRSAAILRAKWGASVGGEGRLTVIGLLVVIPATLVGVIGGAIVSQYGVTAYAAAGPILIGLAVATVLATLIALQALGAIFQAGVYLYASNGAVPAGMDNEMLENAFKTKKR